MRIRSHIFTVIVCAILFACLLAHSGTAAQTSHQLPPYQSEQDACGALEICGNTFTTPFSYAGTGYHADLISTPCYTGTSSNGGEINSMWMKLTVSSPGRIVFTITPINRNDDYDFAVLNTTGSPCDHITPEQVVRCNFNGRQQGANDNGVIGLSSSSSLLYVENGSNGSSFCEAIDAIANETYLIMINNFGDYLSQDKISKGFTIDFTGSTANFNNNSSARLNNADPVCGNSTQLTLHMNHPVLCNSIAADGSDFSTDAPATIIGASGVFCSSDGGYTSTILLSLSSAVPYGSYTVHARQGSDGNILLNTCNQELSSPESLVPFTVQPPIPPVTVYKSICSEQLPYEWNQIIVTQGGAEAASFTTQGTKGCDSITTLNLTVDAPALQRASSAAICQGEVYQLPWDSSATTAGTFTHAYKNTKGCDSVAEQVNLIVHPVAKVVEQISFCRDSSAVLSAGSGFASYAWNNGSNNESIIVNKPGVYTTEAIDNIGCVAKDTFTASFYPDPQAAFGSTSYLCADGIKEIHAGSGFQSYVWNTGSIGESITTSETGTFWVTLKDNHNCVATDTTTVVIAPLPKDFLPLKISKCKYAEVAISALQPFSQYLWNTNSQTPVLNTKKAGVYWLQATDSNGCVGKAYTTVSDSTCGWFVSLPLAFTPNGDGNNDEYRALVSGTLSEFSLSVYSRWGELLFTTTDYNTSWKGTRNGQPLPNGTYIYVCRYRFGDEATVLKKGTLTLLR